MQPFGSKEIQLGRSGSELTIGLLLWAAIHGCVVGCCFMWQIALSHFMGSVLMLLPLFESWTYSSLPQLPSLRARSVSSSVPLLDDPHPPALSGSNTPLPQDRPQSSEVPSLRGLVQQLVELCRGNQRLISNLRDEVSQLRAHYSLPISAATHVLARHLHRLPPPPSPPVPRPRGSSAQTMSPFRLYQQCSSPLPSRVLPCTLHQCLLDDHADGRRPRECRAREFMQSSSLVLVVSVPHIARVRCVSLHRGRAPVCSDVSCTAASQSFMCARSLSSTLLSSPTRAPCAQTCHTLETTKGSCMQVAAVQ